MFMVNPRLAFVAGRFKTFREQVEAQLDLETCALPICRAGFGALLDFNNAPKRFKLRQSQTQGATRHSICPI